MYLQDIQDKKDEESARSNQLYALRRGLQLRHYVHTIRTELHEERARKKFERQNEIIRLYVSLVARCAFVLLFALSSILYTFIFYCLLLLIFLCIRHTVQFAHLYV